jgi:exopolyphosphatase/guanosine-5'-triphosphate,3'-diphosphate pyrophosphatase
MILAGIDIGTNTLRLLIAETGPDSFRELASDRKITRLGQNLERTGMVSPDAEERSLLALAEFQGHIQEWGVQHTAAIGTSALRNAKNAGSFINAIRDRTGISIRVITGEEEARLSLLGVSKSLEGRHHAIQPKQPSSALVIDIGGGSTEIIMTRIGRPMTVVSMPLGAVYLTERFIRHDPPTSSEIAGIRQAVASELQRAGGTIEPDANSLFIGTAGTITTLAAIEQGLIDYDPQRINKSLLTRDFIEESIGKLAALPLEQRRTIRGLEPGREDIVLAGAIVAEEIMKYFHYTSMLVSDWGLREGIVLDLYSQLSGKDLSAHDAGRVRRR